MILNAYFIRHLLSISALVIGFLLLLAWMPRALDMLALSQNTLGEPLTIEQRLLIAFSQSVLSTLELSSIAFMIATLISLTLLGRRAELHIVRGAGHGPLSILSTYAVAAAFFTLIFTFILAPASLEFSSWGKRQLDPQTDPRDSYFAGPYTVWLSLDGGMAQARLQGYDSQTQSAKTGHLVFYSNSEQQTENGANSHETGLELNELGFYFLDKIRLTQKTLTTEIRSLDGQVRVQRFTLDRPPQTLERSNAAIVRSLPHLFGWIGPGVDPGLSERKRSFALHRELSSPFVSAALALLAGTLCVSIGTRQSLSLLIFGALALVVATYCLVVVSEAFGENGKLNPILAAWGPALMLFGLGLATLMGQELFWVLGKSRLKYR